MTLWPPDHEPTRQERDAALDLLNEKIQEAERKMLREIGDQARAGRSEIRPGVFLAFEEFQTGWHLTLSFLRMAKGKTLLTAAPKEWRIVAVQHIPNLLWELRNQAREEAKSLEVAVSSLNAFLEYPPP